MGNDAAAGIAGSGWQLVAENFLAFPVARQQGSLRARAHRAVAHLKPHLAGAGQTILRIHQRRLSLRDKQNLLQRFLIRRIAARQQLILFHS